jgi:regulation of enolase protein 1 (concanavalin A-like superfamily)
MLRLDEKNWVKTGIEYTDGLMHFSVVVTREVSDWSVIPLHKAKPADDIHVRLTRHGDAVRVQYAIAGGAWQMARLAPFPADDALVGVMACSPERAGFTASFHEIEVGPAIARQLHGD